jgi:hypothetical protein
VCLATGWENAEYRSYEFADPTGEDPGASLKETSESWERRRGREIQPTETEQRELMGIYYKEVGPYLKYGSHP